jgi:2',3'-cyclic-nucleotide 2'-phosphodiesterase (5'-nucleotidase family)/subtilisin family serine protease
MSRLLYKLFAVAVSISMIVALPALALPVSSPAAQNVEPASIAPQTSQPASKIAQQPLPRHPEVTPVGEDGSQLKGPHMPESGPVSVIIELQDEPAAVTYAAAQDSKLSSAQATAATQKQIARIEAAQKQLLPALAKLDATVIYRVQRVYNGIAVRIDAAKVKDLEALPGVKAVHQIVSKTLDNWHSVPLIGAPQLWDSAGLFGGLTGEGIKVGIIDSGVDYGHADFGGLATQAAYAANDTTVITDTYNGKLLYPTMKVVDGWDFVGDDYDPGSGGSADIPQPDPDPAPCYTGGESADHGTHVAGTTGGYGVNADGSTYTGPYAPGIDFSAFIVGPGVAPEAELYSLRVFGCNGATDVVDQAIEWSVDPNGDGDFSDHLDVINMSLGSDFGDGLYDSTSVASNNASLAGVVVVASIGNAGDAYFAAGSPGTAERVLSVAASDDGAAILDGFQVTAPSDLAGVYPASESFLYDWTSEDLPITGKLVYPLPGSNPAQDQRTGCYTYDITNTQMISGNIVLMDWNEPSCGGSVTRGGKAVAAGAIGAIMVYNSAPFDLPINGSAVIPAYSAPTSSVDPLKAGLAANKTITVVMTSQYQGTVPYMEPAATDTMATFSSRGPRRDSLLKPDITAPGVSIFSAYNGTGTEGLSYSGTSMAAPHVAGSMALLKQLHPGWSVEELKALVMNTATTDITQLNGAAPKYGPGRVGAGRITLPTAAASNVVAFDSDAPWLTSVSFGAPEVLNTTSVTKYVKVVNKNNAPLVYQVSYQDMAVVPGVIYTVSPAQIKLPAYGTTLIAVTMAADPSLMRNTADPTVPTNAAAGYSWLSEAAGYVVLTPGFKYNIYLPLVMKSGTPTTTTGTAATPRLRVPVYAAPRPASDVYAGVSALNISTVTGTVGIPLTGTVGIATGVNNPYDIISLVTGYELVEASPQDLTLPPGAENADLKYVGVTNDNRVATAKYVTNTVVYFGISTWGEHATPTEVEYDLYIDSDQNGTWDYNIWNTNTGTAFGGDPTDVFVTEVCNLHTDDCFLDNFVNITPGLDTYIFNSNLMVLPVSAAMIGLNNANPRFDYVVETYAVNDYGYDLIDATTKHTYSAAAAGLDFTAPANNPWGLPGTVDMPGSGISVNYDLTQYQANGSQGALLLHHHNEAGMREEVVDVNVTTPNNQAAFTILHHNDFHGQLELSGSNPGYARVAGLINQIRNQIDTRNVLLLDAGDEMQGSLLSNVNKGAPVIDLFNEVGVAAATFGNHEFDWGQQVLIDRTQQADYPYVTANIVVSDTGNCNTAGWTTPSFAQPWTTKTVGAPGNQVVVGIIGVTTLEVPQITIASATQGLCFKDPAQSINHYIPAMKAAGAQVIVVLSHLGYPDGGYGYGIPVYGDQTLARNLFTLGTPVNLIIGGHSHTNLTAATVITSAVITTTTTSVVQANYNGRNLGRADLIVNKTSGAVTINWQSIPVNSTVAPEDVAAKAKIASWANDPAYQALVNTPIGYSAVDLPRLGGRVDNMMATFVDDAIYNYLNNDGTSANDIDLFFNNAGGIRTDWCYNGTTWVNTGCASGTHAPALLTYGNMFTILPFGNATVVGKMTGAQIMDVVNYGPLVSNGVIQPAGLKYTYYSYTDTNPGPQPYAWGAYSVTVKNKSTGLYEPLVLTKTYSVGTNEFLAPAGGDGYNGFKYMTNISYWGDMLNAVNAWVTANYTLANPYLGPNGDGTLDGRIIRNGGNTYTGAATEVVPVTVLHHNDSHGRLVPTSSAPGYTNLVSLIKQEKAHNPTRTILLQAGDNIQGDAMAAFYKAAFTGKGSDGTTLPITLTVNPIMAAFNALNYDAMTLGNHEFNFGNFIFTGTLGQANFPLLQANLYDDGAYGIDEVNVRPYITKTLPGSVGPINVAVLGIGNHRVPQYELPSNIPGLTFTNPITEAQNRAPALKATNDVVVALTHIGFTSVPGSLEVDENVDTNLAAQTTGVDAIIGGHSHTNPSSADAPYKFLPTYVGNPANTPVIINQAYRYNTYLGEVVMGLLPKAGGGYDVVSRAGRYLANATTVPEDAAVKAIVKPYNDFLTVYRTRAIGRTAVPIDTTNAYIGETNAANQQADASMWKLTSTLPISIDFHLSGAMTQSNPKMMFPTASVATPVTMTVDDMFTLMPYENSLVVMDINGAQLKAILERGFRNYWYYKTYPNDPNPGGYSKYTTCMLNVSAGAVITYQDTLTYTPSSNYVLGMSVKGVPIDFTAATTYTVSTVNYLAAGSCNFNNSGVSLWPLDQIVADTQNYVRDVVIEYTPLLPQPISPMVEGRLRFLPPTP